MNKYLPTLMLASLVAPIAEAEAATRYNFDISAGTLGQALTQLSTQSGSSIGSVNINLQRYRVSRLRGSYTVQQALRRLLDNTDLDFVVLSAKTIRIVRKRRSPKSASRSKNSRTISTPNPSVKPQMIIVTASKTEALLEDFHGSAQVIDVASTSNAEQSGGLEGLLSTLPTTAQTNLGSGRNKLFLRGIADSSLIGTTQSTVGLYLDEARLSYSGPNPDLRTYDQARVEILEGPQGTLFGAGTIGGIVKIVTNKPDSISSEGSLWTNVGITQGGDVSYDAAAMLNLPLSDKLALRTVGYYQHNGGYIDDISRNLDDVNRNEIWGGRAALRFTPGDDWTFDLNLLHQSNQTADGQYAERNLSRRARASDVEQPFEADVTGASFTVTKQWDKLELISSFGYFTHKNESSFDRSVLSDDSSPMVFNEEINSKLFTHETRVRWLGDNGHSAVLGVSYLNNLDRVDLEMGTPDDPQLISATDNGNIEAAIFGEGTYQISDRLSASLGGRVTYSRSVAEIIIESGQEIGPSRKTLRFLPKISLGWKPNSNGLIYASYQEGFRSGGISVGLGTNNPITEFASDTIETFEAGIKIGMRQDSRFRANIMFFYSNWNDIQADLIDEAGFPRTTNIGDGRVYGVSLSADWAVTDRLSIYGRYFANESELASAANGFVAGDESQLPNIAEMGANGGARWTIPVSEDRQIGLRADVRYVGQSQLGIDPFLSIGQGDYVLVNGTAEYRAERWSAFVALENLFNSSANTFSLGNPFTVADGLQITPLRPRSLKLGAKIDF